MEKCKGWTDVNVELVQIVNPNKIKVLIHERGVGLSRSCGSGCTSVVHLGYVLGKLTGTVDIELDDGVMQVFTKEDTYWSGAPVNHIYSNI